VPPYYPDTPKVREGLAQWYDNIARMDTEVGALLRQLDEDALRVRDQGVGISTSEFKRIFKRFYRIPGAVATRVKGTGLGLFIVRQIVRAHGGTVSLSSGEGKTVFTVKLPRNGPPA